MSPDDKPLVWLRGKVKTPPFSLEARLEAGYLFRKLQRGELLSLLHSRPMPSIGARCYELRLNDKNSKWRIVYRIDADAIVIVKVFQKKTRQTPDKIIKVCQQRLAKYDQDRE